ncbi:coagulation factor XIII A chain-like [Triplophysa dalaica]|uniref:coagulation factor XIII A chain-like n=1 Tax=Triplophysa dalaica TaxID=1582913 RepID=UPI0024DF96B7|nr:coagulation factor XIII A chain-like [Triplophysa dalaica]
MLAKKRTVGRYTNATSNSVESELPRFELYYDGLQPRGTPDEATLAESLSVLSVDMRVTENKAEHITDKYKNSNLIVRRNKEFTIIIKFDRDFNKEKDNVEMEFLIGSKPDENKGTYIVMSIGKENRDVSWKCRVVNIEGRDVTVGITPDPNCIVGRFRIFMVVVSDVGKQRTPRNPDNDVYVLFNPWDSADQVYIKKEEERQEYVLNDVGVIFIGDFNEVSSRSWNFGQFEQGILDACLLILDSAKVPLVFRGNATEVIRQASALMNAQDDDGVLIGNWSGEYSEGTSPTAWTGSTEILLKYASEGATPVAFAQCWVFAGVLNTFLRCLGLPARVITNYSSAHDNTGNLKTDIILDEDGKLDKEKTRDSVWNYHCWNEVYMKRTDLPEKFWGWQVVDATPQETSDGLYRCGPTSVAAVKEGELSYPFDARFVFAELNSDVIYHKADKTGKTKIIYVDTAYVGKLTVTKKCDSNEYEDITTTYKYPEGTLKEREAMQMAERRGVAIGDYFPLTEAGVDMELKADVVKMGEDFKLNINIKNQTTEKCTISIILTGCVVFYTGVTSSVFKTENKDATVEPSQTETVQISIQAAEYMRELVEQSNLLFVVYGHIEELNQSLSTMRVVTLLPPELTIQVNGTPQVGKELMVSVEFLNPYNFILKNVQLRLDGPGLIKTKLKKYKQIFPGGSIKYKESIIPLIYGKKTLIASLDCAALRQVTNEIKFDVLKAAANPVIEEIEKKVEEVPIEKEREVENVINNP